MRHCIVQIWKVYKCHMAELEKPVALLLWCPDTDPRTLAFNIYPYMKTPHFRKLVNMKMTPLYH